MAVTSTDSAQRRRRRIASTRGCSTCSGAACPTSPTHTIAAVTDEVPSYAGAFGGPMGDNIENAVQMALAGFLRLAARGRSRRPRYAAVPRARGRLRAGARRGPQRPERRRPALGLPGRRPGRLARARRDRGRGGGAGRHAGVLRRAGLRLHRRAVRGLASPATPTSSRRSGRVRQGYLDRLGLGILRGDPADALVAAAERADWVPPTTLTAVLVPSAQVRPVQGLLDPRTLSAVGEPVTLPDGVGVLLVPDAGRPRPDPAGAHAGRAVGRGRPGTPVARRRHVVRAARSGRSTCGSARRRTTPRSTSPTSSSPPTPKRSPTCGPGCSRRSPPCGRRPGRSSPRPCARGCSTRAGATTSRPRSSCTRRPCATGWASSASCTATGSTTRDTVRDLTLALA